MVLASSPELIEDIRKAPDHVLSLNAALREVRNFPEMVNSCHDDYASSSNPRIHWTYWNWIMTITRT
jgi:hypothetical protein